MAFVKITKIQIIELFGFPAGQKRVGAFSHTGWGRSLRLPWDGCKHSGAAWPIMTRSEKRIRRRIKGAWLQRKGTLTHAFEI